MPINPSVKSYAELDISEDYSIRIEHVHDKKYDLHELVIKRKVLDPETKEDKKDYHTVIEDINKDGSSIYITSNKIKIPPCGGIFVDALISEMIIYYHLLLR